MKNQEKYFFFRTIVVADVLKRVKIDTPKKDHPHFLHQQLY